MLKELYDSVVKNSLQNRFEYKNSMEIPKIVKTSVNVGLGNVDTKYLNEVVDNLTRISGQIATVTVARKSISGFKIREGNKLGCKVTLRSFNMYFFIERLLYFALPRSRDFNGFSLKQFDGRGNLNIGLSDHSVFPEASYDKFTKAFGMNINIVTTAKTNEEARELLSLLGFPFINKIAN